MLNENICCLPSVTWILGRCYIFQIMLTKIFLVYVFSSNARTTNVSPYLSLQPEKKAFFAIFIQPSHKILLLEF